MWRNMRTRRKPASVTLGVEQLETRLTPAALAGSVPNVLADAFGRFVAADLADNGKLDLSPVYAGATRTGILGGLAPATGGGAIVQLWTLEHNRLANYLQHGYPEAVGGGPIPVGGSQAALDAYYFAITQKLELVNYQHTIFYDWLPALGLTVPEYAGPKTVAVDLSQFKVPSGIDTPAEGLAAFFVAASASPSVGGYAGLAELVNLRDADPNFYEQNSFYASFGGAIFRDMIKLATGVSLADNPFLAAGVDVAPVVPAPPQSPPPPPPVVVPVGNLASVPVVVAPVSVHHRWRPRNWR